MRKSRHEQAIEDELDALCSRLEAARNDAVAAQHRIRALEGQILLLKGVLDRASKEPNVGQAAGPLGPE